MYIKHDITQKKYIKHDVTDKITPRAVQMLTA